MKRLFFILTTSSIFIACNNKASDEKTSEEKKEEKMDSTKYAYKADYSSDFKMGDADHSVLVLNFFKAWEENRMDDMKPMLTDSVWVEFSDGNKFNGTADSLIATGKQFRANYSSIKTTLDGWMSVHSNDKNEDYVLVWGKDYNTDKTGKLDSMRGHSYWQIKNDKISGWSEFTQKLVAMPPPPPPKKQ
jgi:ketosteroid isomerase-like protein